MVPEACAANCPTVKFELRLFLFGFLLFVFFASQHQSRKITAAAGARGGQAAAAVSAVHAMWLSVQGAGLCAKTPAKDCL